MASANSASHAVDIKVDLNRGIRNPAKRNTITFTPAIRMSIGRSWSRRERRHAAPCSAPAKDQAGRPCSIEAFGRNSYRTIAMPRKRGTFEGRSRRQADPSGQATDWRSRWPRRLFTICGVTILSYLRSCLYAHADIWLECVVPNICRLAFGVTFCAKCSDVLMRKDWRSPGEL